MIDADPDAGFNYPYFLHAPSVEVGGERPILVMVPTYLEPSDTLQDHIDKARDLIEGLGAHYANELGVPVLVPVIPLYKNESPTESHFAPALDADTLALEDTDLERIDEQILAAIDDAADRLASDWEPVASEVLLDGSAASGLFANRFAALHPTRVRSVTAGDFSGTALLPTGEADDKTTLPYPVGVADLPDLVGDPFNADAFAAVDQFIYQANTTDDLVANPNIWNDDERSLVSDVYGENVVSRIEHSEAVYEDAGLTASFARYDGDYGRSAGKSDIFAHHRPHIGVSSISISTRPDVGAETLDVEGYVDADDGKVDVRVSLEHSDGMDITANPLTLQDESFDDAVSLDQPLEAGDFVTVSLYKTGSTDAEDIIVEDRRAIDATTVQVDETPTAGDTLVRVTATTSDDDLEAFDDDLEIRVGDADGTELTEAPVSVNVLRITDISLTRSLTAGEELTVVAQPPGEYDPNAEFATTTTVDQPNESVVEISERPDTGAESLTIEGFVDDDDGEVDARVRLGAEADIAVDAPTLQPGGSFDESISLDQPLEAGDLPILNLYKTGSTDEEDIVASFGISVDATTVEIDQPVTDGDNAIWLTATASDELLADQDPVVRVADADGTDLTTEPETVGAAWGGEFELTKSVTAGDELTVVVQPPGEYDPDAAFASATTTVGESLDLEPAFTFEPESPDVETEVSFDASPTEPSSDVATYSWGFTGNEEIDSEGQEVTHTFSEAGEHEVVLVAQFEIDGDTYVETTSQTVHVREGCFIATAACGTPDHAQVETLRSFRDQTLKGNPIGEFAVRAYYATSPPIADWIARSRRRRKTVRATIVRPAARVASALGLSE